jgi:Trk-type K+ transport system membrane component
MSPEPSSSRVHPCDALATIGCVYLALVTFGFAAFRYLAVLPVGAKRNQDLTFFNSVNAVSLTGFEQVNAAVANYPTLGLVVLSLLALMSALTSLIGGGYLFARVVGWRVSLFTLSLWSGGLLVLPLVMAFLIGDFNAISASTGLGLIGRPMPTFFWLSVAIGLASFSVFGVLPLKELFCSRKSDHDPDGLVAAVITATVATCVVGAVALWLCGSPWRETATQSLALRSAGDAAGPKLGVSPVMPWVTMLLALIGAAPASTAGGLGVLPIVVAIRGAVQSLRGQTVDRLLGVALAWITSFAAAVFVFTIALATFAPALPPERVLLLVCSALGNVGISYEPVGITGASLFALSGAMLVGRLLPFVMLAWMACVTERATPSLRSP